MAFLDPELLRAVCPSIRPCAKPTACSRQLGLFDAAPRPPRTSTARFATLAREQTSASARGSIASPRGSCDRADAVRRARARHCRGAPSRARCTRASSRCRACSRRSTSHPLIEEMRRRARASATARTSCASTAALYRDGHDSVAFHGDTTARDMVQATVATVSLGAARKFLLKPTEGGRSQAYALGGGDLVVMGGTCQRTWRHAIPKVTARRRSANRGDVSAELVRCLRSNARAVRSVYP